jgi:hypothetical protein
MRKVTLAKRNFQENFDPESAAVLGMLPSKDWVDLLG